MKGSVSIEDCYESKSIYFCLVGAGNNDLCSDSFISKQTIIVNALDNVEARRYMDSYVTHIDDSCAYIDWFFETLCNQ